MIYICNVFYIIISLFQFCTASQVSNKRLFPTFARTEPHDAHLGSAIVTLLQYFNWRTVAFIYKPQLGTLKDAVMRVGIESGETQF